MASRAMGLFDPGTVADRWIAEYDASSLASDVLRARQPDDTAWSAMFEELAGTCGDSLGTARERIERQAEDVGIGFRMAGEGEERPWPLSPIPLILPEAEWSGIAAGVIQRAELMETILADIYGPGRLVAQGHIPAALVTGSPWFLRPMMGLEPGGKRLQFVAVDLCRGPTGEWRVLADHLRTPAGAGYALENRLALSRVLVGLQSRLNMARHAPFFAAFKAGLAARSRHADPRIALLTPGRFNASYAEQAHLARYLGFLLVQGADLTVIEDRLYLRTIAGLKRVDGIWNRVDPRLLDPLALDSHSTVGVAGLIDAMAAANVVIANTPGAGVLESPAFAAFLPALATRLTGESLALPNIATWWCGRAGERAQVRAELDSMVVAPAFGVAPLGLRDGRPRLGAEIRGPEREALLADMERRPMDYVGREIVHLSTMPVVAGDALVARPFILRVFAARGEDGSFEVLPGGFARIGASEDVRAAVMGKGTWSADVIVHGPDPVTSVSLLASGDDTPLRRNPGTLPSRAADNLFWLGRYLERGEALLGAVRMLLGHSISADTGAALAEDTVRRIADLLFMRGAAPKPGSLRRTELTDLARTALDGADGWYGVRTINAQAQRIAQVSRERLSADMMRLLDAPFPEKGSLLDRAGTLQRRYSALAGQSAEHMARTDAWRFHDLGRRIERAVATIGILRTFATPRATGDDLLALLDLADSQISYRQRYLTGLARVPVLDLVALDPGNPRGLGFQVVTIVRHLSDLPVLSDDGLAEPQQSVAAEIAAIVATARAAALDDAMLADLDRRLGQLSDAIARRYFLQGAEPLRAGGLTLA